VKSSKVVGHCDKKKTGSAIHILQAGDLLCIQNALENLPFINENLTPTKMMMMMMNHCYRASWTWSHVCCCWQWTSSNTNEVRRWHLLRAKIQMTKIMTAMATLFLTCHQTRRSYLDVHVLMRTLETWVQCGQIFSRKQKTNIKN